MLYARIVPMGPACWMVYPELRNRPVPITPPREIIVRWRDSIFRSRPVSSLGVPATAMLGSPLVG